MPMRVAVIYRPRNVPPPELMPTLFAELSAWVERYRDRMETLEFFVGGGGFAVADIDDSAELHRLTSEHPFTPFAEVEVRPVVDPEVGLRNLQEAFEARSAGG
jgi:hypothetical protein